MERRLMNEYLQSKRPLQLLPRLIEQLTEGERTFFFKLFPEGIDKNKLPDALALVQRTLSKKEKENAIKSN